MAHPAFLCLWRNLITVRALIRTMDAKSFQRKEKEDEKPSGNLKARDRAGVACIFAYAIHRQGCA
jgi:hypothetical protein